jgi:hypothetical protein
MPNTLREVVKVTMHVNGGFTRVSVESMEGEGLADGRVEWEIPTHLIPPHLRNIGCRFIVSADLPQSQEREHMYDGVRIDEIKAD